MSAFVLAHYFMLHIKNLKIARWACLPEHFSTGKAAEHVFLQMFTAMIQNKYVQTARSLKIAVNEFTER